MKQLALSFSILLLALAFGCKQRTETASSGAKGVYDDQWRAQIRCENDSVRLDRMSHLYDKKYQLVINHQDAIARLRREGGINSDMVNSKGELIIPFLQSKRAFQAYIGFAPRDAGHLAFTLVDANVPHKLNLTVTYTAGDINNFEFADYIKPFTGYEFGGCAYETPHEPFPPND